MNTPKTYSLHPGLHWSDSKNHKLVRAAHRRGLTGIKMILYSSSSRNNFQKTGWYLQCYQMPELFCGYNAAEAETRINRIEVYPIKINQTITQ